MTHKIHLRQSVNGSPACAILGVRADGTVIRNGRVTYQTMSATVVSVDEFRETPAADRCAHCCDRFTPMLNRRRAKAGKALYADAMTKTFA